MLFEPDPMILDLNRKLLEEIEVFKPTKIAFNNLERAKDELIVVVGNFKIDTWNFTLLDDDIYLLEMWSGEDWWIPM